VKRYFIVALFFCPLLLNGQVPFQPQQPIQNPGINPGPGLNPDPTQLAQRLIGFSNYFNQVTQLSDRSFEIFAGNTGKTCSGNGQLPCNSCHDSLQITALNPATQGLVCNDRQIYPDLLFTITMNSTSEFAYPIGCNNLLIGLDGVNLVSPFQVTQYTPGVINQNVTASWRWSTICEALSGDATCRTSFTRSIRIGFNSNCSNTALLEGAVDFNIAFRYVQSSPFMSFGCPATMGAFESYCDYTIFPGDQKLYILNSAANVANNLDAGDQSGAITPTAATTRDPSGIKYNAIRAYYAQGSFRDIILNSSFTDIPISLSGGLTDRRISGLVNGLPYAVLIANKDEAGNVELFAHPGNPGNDPGLPMSDLTNDLGNTQAGIPQEVVGLLEDQRCFIATAAFGSPHDQQVMTLRKFRDEVLNKHEFGKSFVNWYYSWSPSVSKWIASKNWMRVLIRGILWPLVWLIDLAQAQELGSPLKGNRNTAKKPSSELAEDAPKNLVAEISKSESEIKNSENIKQVWPSPEPFISSGKEIRAGKRRVEHPLEERGLLKINTDGSYDYAIYGERRKRTSSFSIYNLPSLRISSNTGNYSDFYGTSNPAIFSITGEWLVFPNVSHNLSVRLSGGFGSVTGNGILVDARIPAEERYTLYSIPLSTQILYRLDYIRNQWVAPYVMGGGGYLGLVELRDDSSSIKFAGAPFIETGGGLLVSLMRIDPKSMFVLRRDYGISDIWINFEAKAIASLRADIDFEGSVFGAGLVLDF